MIGTNIKKLRLEQGMTQKALADKLFVSAQAVSRWENNEVEPSIGTIIELAKIFGVSTDDLLGSGIPEPASEPESVEPEIVIEKEYVYKDPPPQILTLCTRCNNPIYQKQDIVRVYEDKIICKSCDEKEKKQNLQNRVYKSERRRRLSFILGPLASVVSLLILLGLGCFNSLGNGALCVLFSISMFTFVSCFLLANNFVGDMALTIFSWGFIKMPMLIFSFSIDGCLGFIVAKIILFLMGLVVGIFFALLAIGIGGFVSLFVYPFAIKNNFNHPERIDEFS